MASVNESRLVEAKRFFLRPEIKPTRRKTLVKAQRIGGLVTAERSRP